MSIKLFVGGLPYSVLDDQLREVFTAAGTVQSAQVIVDRETNRSKGFGFIEMSTDDEARAAVDMFNGKEIEGRLVTVNEAKPKESRDSRSYGSNNSSRNNSRRSNDSGGNGRRY